MLCYKFIVINIIVHMPCLENLNFSALGIPIEPGETGLDETKIDFLIVLKNI